MLKTRTIHCRSNTASALKKQNKSIQQKLAGQTRLPSCKTGTFSFESCVRKRQCGSDYNIYASTKIRCSDVLILSYWSRRIHSSHARCSSPITLVQIYQTKAFSSLLFFFFFSFFQEACGGKSLCQSPHACPKTTTWICPLNINVFANYRYRHTRNSCHQRFHNAWLRQRLSKGVKLQSDP